MTTSMILIGCCVPSSCPSHDLSHYSFYDDNDYQTSTNCLTTKRRNLMMWSYYHYCSS